MRYPNTAPNYGEIARQLIRINPVELVTAVNATSEKQAWLNAIATRGFTIPTYQYNRELLSSVALQRPTFEGFKSVIEAEMHPDSKNDAIIKNLLITRLEEAITSTILASSILANDMSVANEAVEKLYGHPDEQLLKDALDLQIDISDHDSEIKYGFITPEECEKLEAIEFDATGIYYCFKKALDAYGINNWKVEVDKKYTAIDVRDKNADGISVVGIPADRVVNGLKLLELTRHEIECHLRGSENCRHLVASMLEPDSPLKPFIEILAKSDNEKLYEGVAKYNDVLIGGDHGMPRPYATFACDWALSGATFNRIAAALYPIMMSEKAPLPKKELLEELYKITYRVIRGTVNTREGDYSFTKDYNYLAGYYMVMSNPDSPYCDFASMKLSELNAIEDRIGIPAPKYPLISGLITEMKNEFLSH